MVDKCVCCENDSFTDKPEGWVTNRWGGRKEEFPACTCDKCGATYPRTSIDEKVRKEA